MAIYTFRVYRTTNIGLFFETSERLVLVPKGLALTKVEKLSSMLGREAVATSIHWSRLLGPLITMNSNGIIVSRLATDEEISELRRKTNLNVERLEHTLTSVGNIIVANDRGAIISKLLPAKVERRIRDVLGVESIRMSVAGYTQIGAVVFATNRGALCHPLTSEDEMKIIGDLLKAKVSQGTINGGVPFVSSGIIGNSENIVVGYGTTGREFMVISSVFQ